MISIYTKGFFMGKKWPKFARFCQFFFKKNPNEIFLYMDNPLSSFTGLFMKSIITFAYFHFVSMRGLATLFLTISNIIV
jgi:hypothetical protein